MQYTKIPGTDMQASRICLGTMTFGSPVAGPDAVRLVRYALEEHGVNFIDTANTVSYTHLTLPTNSRV